MPTVIANSLSSRRSELRSGFTVVEGMVALTIAMLASSALLLALQTSLNTTSEAVDIAIAEGLAQQLLDEVMHKRYMGPLESPTATTLGPTGFEPAGPGRSKFDDTDDFANWTATPAQGLYGETLGTGTDVGNTLRPANFRVPTNYFQRWRQRIAVYYVDATSLQKLTSGTSSYRAVEVVIDQKNAAGDWLTLAKKRKVYPYVPAYAQ